jgi:uncharacterized damage-inducible protein DinB
MEKQLHERYNQLQTETKLLLKAIASLSSTTYHYKPGDQRWSISQILTHLMVAEKLSTDYMKKKALGLEDLDDAGVIEDLKLLILKISQRLPFKYKAPNVVLEKTPAPLSFGDLVRQWEVVRADLVQFLQKFNEQTVRRKVYKHPVAGRLSVVQALDFFTEHLNHHRPQVRRIIEEVKNNKL